MRLAELLANSGHCEVTIDGEKIAVDYRTHYVTPEMEAKLKTIGESQEQVKMAFDLLCGLVISWDVQGEDGKMLPLTSDSLQAAGFTGDLAGTFLSQILTAGSAVGEANAAS